jgi:hypothetical protein
LIGYLFLTVPSTEQIIEVESPFLILFKQEEENERVGEGLPLAFFSQKAYSQ